MNESSNGSLWPALVLAFLPAVVVLVAGTFGGQTGPPQPVIWTILAGSLACCFVSSFLLFRRKTAWAIVGGIVFLLINGLIALFVGCVALVKGMNS